MTVNILLKESELGELVSYIRPYYEAGVDGLIMQDLGAVRRIRAAFPDLEVHASTQQTITSVWGARMAQHFGMTRAVLSRELSLAEIWKIHEESGMELEVFCHGAMCYSYSGACFMSSCSAAAPETAAAVPAPVGSAMKRRDRRAIISA